MAKLFLPPHKTLLGQPNPHQHQHNVVDGKIVSYVKNVKLHEFNMGDVEDPEIYAASPIWQWQQTDYGKWCMKNALDTRYTIVVDHNTYGYKVIISGDLPEKAYTFFNLKYATIESRR